MVKNIEIKKSSKKEDVIENNEINDLRKEYNEIKINRNNIEKLISEIKTVTGTSIKLKNTIYPQAIM